MLCSLGRSSDDCISGRISLVSETKPKQQAKTQDMEGFRGAKGRVLHPQGWGSCCPPPARRSRVPALRSLTKALHLASSFWALDSIAPRGRRTK